MDARGSRLTLALVAGLIVVLAAGVGIAIWVGHDHRVDAAASSADAASAPGSGSTASAAAVSKPSVAAGSAAGSGSSVASTSAIGPSTNLTVALSAAAARHAHATDYQSAMQRMFDAINAHDYQSWAGAVTEQQLRGQDQGAWTHAYSSTTDSNITVLNIVGDQAQVTFVSTQDAALAPTTLPSTCIAWTLTYSLAEQGGRWIIGSTLPGSVTMASCA